MQKKNFRLLTYALVILSALAFSCSDDDEKGIDIALLTAHPWSATKAEISYKGASEDISEDYLQDCEDDDTIIFHEDGTFETTVGEDLCWEDQVGYTGTWEVKDGKLVVKYDNDTYNVSVLQLTSSTLKASWPWEDLEGATLVLTYAAVQ